MRGSVFLRSWEFFTTILYMNTFEEQGADEIIFPAEKQTAWDEMSEKIEQTTDALGKEIEPGIKDAVIASNLLGLHTSSSCEGHADRGMGAPWIQYRAERKPRERFIGQKEVLEAIFQKHGLALPETIKWTEHPGLYDEWTSLASENGETEEYKAWCAQRDALAEKINNLLAEFYKERQVTSSAQLVVEAKRGVGSFRLHNGGDDFSGVKKLSKEQQQEFAKRLPTCQDEFSAFTKFLKKKIVEL